MLVVIAVVLVTEATAAIVTAAPTVVVAVQVAVAVVVVVVVVTVAEAEATVLVVEEASLCLTSSRPVGLPVGDSSCTALWSWVTKIADMMERGWLLACLLA